MDIRAKVESTFFNYNRLGMASIYLAVSADGIPPQKFGGSFYEDPLRVVRRALAICNAKSWEAIPGKEILPDVEDGKVVNISSLNGRVWFGRFSHATVDDIVEFEMD
jgi:hypothetical protein